MNWSFTLGCVTGGVAAVLILTARRVSRYCLSLWRVVTSVQPRRRGAGADASTQCDSPREEQHEITDARLTSGVPSDPQHSAAARSRSIEL
jgi:hypothetical protein